jgi:hypothetical protein
VLALARLEAGGERRSNMTRNGRVVADQVHRRVSFQEGRSRLREQAGGAGGAACGEPGSSGL